MLCIEDVAWASRLAVSPAVRGLAELRRLLVCTGITIFWKYTKYATCQPSSHRTNTATQYVARFPI